MPVDELMRLHSALSQVIAASQRALSAPPGDAAPRVTVA